MIKHVLAVMGMAVVFAVGFGVTALDDAAGTGCNKPNPPAHCNPTTTTTTTTPPPTVPPPPRVCPDGKPPTPGEGAYDKNDDCKRPPDAPPVTTTTTPTPPPPPPVLNCPTGMTELGRTATQVTCGTIITKTVVKTKTATKILVKKRTKFIEFCPKPRNGKKLTG